MYLRKHLEILRKGVAQWNAWRGRTSAHPDLRGVDLKDANLRGANFDSTDLTAADLRRADLTDANLSDAKLARANLECASLRNTNLEHASLTEAWLRGADFTDAHCFWTEIKGVDLSTVEGREVFDTPGAVFPDFTPPAPYEFKPAVKPTIDSKGLHLFLSFTRSEEEIASGLMTAFEDLGHTCWDYLVDPINVTDDDALGDELFGRIMGSDAIIVVASNNAFDRRWVQKEIDMGTTRLRRVLLVVVESHGHLDIPAQTASSSKAQWIVYDGRDPVEGARRSLEKLRDDRPWGNLQKLRWIE